MENFNNFKSQIEMMITTDYESFVKALVSYEKSIVDEEQLNEIYDSYMDHDYYVSVLQIQDLLNELGY